MDNPVQDVVSQTHLGADDLAEAIREGIRRATGIEPPQALIDDLLMAVSVYVSAYLSNPTAADVQVLKSELQRKIQPHIDALVEWVTAMASAAAKKKGEKVYMGWFAGGTTDFVVRNLVSLVITSGVNSLLTKIAASAEAPLPALTEADMQEWVIIPEKGLDESWVQMLPEGHEGYTIFNLGQSMLVAGEVLDKAPIDLNVIEDYDPQLHAPQAQDPQAHGHWEGDKWVVTGEKIDLNIIDEYDPEVHGRWDVYGGKWGHDQSGKLTNVGGERVYVLGSSGKLPKGMDPTEGEFTERGGKQVFIPTLFFSMIQSQGVEDPFEGVQFFDAQEMSESFLQTEEPQDSEKKDEKKGEGGWFSGWWGGS